MEVRFLELKYCERCGGLWLREKGETQVYCAPCALEVAELPAPTKRRMRPRLPVSDKIDLESRSGGCLALCSAGGNA